MRNRKQLRYLAYAQAIKDELETSYKKKEEQVREDLENCINQIFEDIYDGGIQISVSENYNIVTTVIDTDAASGDEIEKIRRKVMLSFLLLLRESLKWPKRAEK